MSIFSHSHSLDLQHKIDPHMDQPSTLFAEETSTSKSFLCQSQRRRDYPDHHTGDHAHKGITDGGNCQCDAAGQCIP